MNKEASKKKNKKNIFQPGRRIFPIFFLILIPITSIIYNQFNYQLLLDPSSYLFSFQLLLAALILGATGVLLKHALKGNFWFSSQHSPTLVHYIFIAQIFLISWIYIRSFANHIIGFVIPITLFDFILILGILLFINYKKSKFRQISYEIVEQRWFWLITVYFIWLLLLIIAQRELPRMIMLSPDADQHALRTLQLFRLHTVPFTSQEYWGATNFNYPAGSAVLNFLWCNLSGLNVINISSVQPVIQIQFGILIIVESIWNKLDKAFKNAGYYFLHLFLIFFVYYLFLTYGYNLYNYYLEKTGSLASTGFMAMGLSFFYIQLINRNNASYGESFHLFFNVFFLSLLISVSFLMNPANLFNIALLILIGGLYFLIVHKKMKKVLSVILGFSGFILIFLEPYYINILNLFLKPQLQLPQQVIDKERLFYLGKTEILSVKQIMGKMFHLFGDKISDFKTVLSLLESKVLSPQGTSILLPVIFILAFILIKTKKIKEYHREIFLLTPILLVALQFLLSMIMESVSTLPGFYILPEYVNTNGQVFFYLWIFSAIVLILKGLLSYNFKKAVVFLCLFLAVFYPATAIEKKINHDPRKNNPGPMGNVYPDDLSVIHDIEKLFQEYKEEHKELTYETIPKILLPNFLTSAHNNERWIFPYAASRVLPFYDTFPPAFYLFQGSIEYSYQNYKHHICENFNVEWLKERNIKYLFLPTQRRACINNGQPIPIKKVLFQKNNAMFLELW